jgi:hypothetical protein
MMSEIVVVPAAMHKQEATSSLRVLVPVCFLHFHSQKSNQTCRDDYFGGFFFAE